MLGKITNERLLIRYEAAIKKFPSCQLTESFRQAAAQTKNPVLMGEIARQLFESESGLGQDVERAEEALLLYVHNFIDWTKLAQAYLDTYHLEQRLKIEIGDKVKVIAPAENLVHPQCLYAGKEGVVLWIDNWLHISFGEDSLSGADKHSGVAFFENELTLVEEKK